MMAGKYNPFRPGSAVTPGMFAGRYEEMELIEQCLLQTKNDNPKHFLIEGERGIGKTSLFNTEEFVASGEIESFVQKENFSFCVVSISLEDKDNYFSIIKKIADRLKRQWLKIDPIRSASMKAWTLISKIEASGVKVHGSDINIDESEMLRALQDDLISFVELFRDRLDGLLILIDEADRPSPAANLGLLCKLLTEEMTRENCDRVCIGLAGLPGVIANLRNSHESSPRIFSAVELKPLSSEDIIYVIERGLKEANSKNPELTKITAEAKALLVSLSEGYPHFLQEFCYCAFDQDDDGVIDVEDVKDSLFKEHGAFDQLGHKYFNNFYNAPASDDYRRVLDVMANHGDDFIDRKALIEESGIKAKTVDNALSALKSRNIIISSEQRRGQYRLPTRSFATWIRIQGFVKEARKNEPSSLFSIDRN